MNKILFLPISAFLLYSVTACANQDIETSTLKTNLLGSWNCLTSYEEDDFSMIIETEDTYVRNGRSNSFGTLKAKFTEELPEIEYSIAATGTWEIIDGYLVDTLTDIKVVNLTHPEFDSIFNLQDLFPTNISFSSEVIELTKSKLTLKSESDDSIYECER
mgnify:CR=1 FL=1